MTACCRFASHLLFACAIMLVVLGRLSSAEDNPQRQNLLPNASFEETEDDVPVGWTSRAWSGHAHGQWSVESPGRTGERCLSIRAERGADAAWTASVSVQPNTFYRLAGWIKTEQIRGAVGALLNIQNMQEVRTSAVTGTTDWTRVATVFRTAAQTTLEINCLFGGWGQSTGQAWYDDVVLEAIDPAAEQTQATVTIDTEGPFVEYSPLIFGGFLEHFHKQVYGGVFEPGSPLADKNGFRTDVIDALKELNVSIVRWPGGCFASGYRWRDGVGPDRSPTPDPVWGVTDPNTFGTDEFVQWCRLIGCEPYICTNAGDGTPQEMQEWVAYCNSRQDPWTQMRAASKHPEPLDVRYWSIGNENWGGHEIGAKTPEQWGPLVRQSARKMLAEDPELILLAAATPDRSWTLPLLEAAGEHLDYVCVHHYWLGNWQVNATPDYRTCIMLSDGPEKLLTQVIGILDEAGCRGRVKIALDEWNLRGWHHPGFPRKTVVDPQDAEARALIDRRDLNAIASQYTMADALFSASVLNACLRHADDVGMANIAPIVNTRGPLFVHPQGVVRRSTFHTLAMYANELESRVAPLDVDAGLLVQGPRAIAMVDGIATVDKSGKHWAIALVNRHPEHTVACTTRLGNTVLDGRYRATVLTGDSPDAYNDVVRPNRVTPKTQELVFRQGVVSLPPHSLTVIQVP